MMLSLHNLSREYKMLPSEALSKATTFDFDVLNIATKWEIKKQNEEKGIKEVPKLTQEQMLDMVEFARNKK